MLTPCPGQPGHGKSKRQAGTGKAPGELPNAVCRLPSMEQCRLVFSKTDKMLGIWSHILLDSSLSSSVKLYKPFLEVERTIWRFEVSQLYLVKRRKRAQAGFNVLSTDDNFDFILRGGRQCLQCGHESHRTMTVKLSPRLHGGAGQVVTFAQFQTALFTLWSTSMASPV